MLRESFQKIDTRVPGDLEIDSLLDNYARLQKEAARHNKHARSTPKPWADRGTELVD